ncbi:MAG: AMP-binding protein [Deltaproteobacteria bacterium]|nr:AMP-binding protein [Deltaproteobacteria bacterium]
MRIERFLLDSERLHPRKTALIVGDLRLSYSALAGMARLLDRRLRMLGVQRADRVVIFLDSSAEAVASIFATAMAGAVFCIVHPSTKADKLAFILSDCSAKAIITQRSLSAVARDACARAPSVVARIEVDSDTPDLVLPDVRTYSAGGVESGAGIDVDLAMIIYTSGSTGFPKGVMMTHRNVDAASASIIEYLENTADDVILNVLPLSFDYGLYQVLMGLRVGATVILEPSFAFPYLILQKLRDERVTGFPIVPTMVAILLRMRGWKPGSLPALRYITNTAAALPPAHIARLQALCPTTRIFSMYGLTECKRCTYLPPEALARHPDSVGIAIPNTEVYVVDDQGQRVGPGVVGELVVRGPHVMQGYWGRPDETARKLRPGPHPWERVLYTGDLFKTDEQGFLYFVGRTDDILKTRGEKVSPKEIENVLYALDGVKEAAVVGVPDPLLGTALRAVLVLDSASSLSAADVVAHCSARLEDFMVPKQIEFRSSLPKTDSGKIMRSALQAEALAGHAASGAA